MKINSTHDLLDASQLSINNTLNYPDMQQQMAQYGFPAKRVKEGKQLLEQFTQQCHQQKDYNHERWALSYRLKNEVKATRQLFVEHVKVARFAFRQDAAILNKLDIQQLVRTQWGWVQQAQAFYTQVADHAAQMASCGVTPEELAQAQASLEAIASMREDLILKKGDAEDATQRKGKAGKELKAWLSEFRAVARLAFRETPQKLEAYGIRVRSRR